MALTEQEKNDHNFMSYRAKKQMKLWPKLVRGESDGLDITQVNPEILDCCLKQKYFRSEGHVTGADGGGRRKAPMEELWMLYIGVDRQDEAEELKDNRKTKKVREETLVVPIKSRRIAYTNIYDKEGKRIQNQYSYSANIHDDGYLDFEAWLFARDQARKDLLWLNREILGNTLVREHVHRMVCDQFVSKNYDDVYFPGYTIEDFVNATKKLNRVPTTYDSSIKNYVPKSQEDIDDIYNHFKVSLTEDARDFFKSTIGRADAIQWMLNAPDVSILILCADNNLAELFVSQIKEKFFLAAGAQPNPLHLLFPEYILRGAEGTSMEPIWCPARRLQRTYPTVWADSIESTLSGLHCDVMKLDDVVSNTNCQTDKTRVKLKNHIDTTMSVCDTWGWVDIIGTRYFPDDYYGYLESESNDDPETRGVKIFKRAAWYVKPEFAHIGNRRIKELKEHMVNLTFPEHASWKFLQGKLKNEYVFRCQYLNEPVWGSDAVDLPLELLKAHMISPTESQSLVGEVYITGDMAKEAKKNSDYSCFVVMKLFRKRDLQTKEQTGAVCVVVLDVDYGKWTQSEIASHLAELNRKWMPKKIKIENTGGLESFISLAIPNAFRQTGLPYYHIHWAPVQQGFDAKKNRIKGLEVLLKADRLFFSMGPWNDETFNQLSSYTGARSTRTRKDDIPDAMSFISQYLPSSTPKSPEEQKQEAEQADREYGAKILRLQYEKMFGSGNFVYTPPTPVEFDVPSGPQDDIRRRYLGR